MASLNDSVHECMSFGWRGQMKQGINQSILGTGLVGKEKYGQVSDRLTAICP